MVQRIAGLAPMVVLQDIIAPVMVRNDVVQLISIAAAPNSNVVGVLSVMVARDFPR